MQRPKVLELLHILIFHKIILLTTSVIMVLEVLLTNKNQQQNDFNEHTFLSESNLVYAGLISTVEGLVNALTILGIGLWCRPLLLPYMAVALLSCLYCLFYLFNMVFFLRVYELGLIAGIAALLLSTVVLYSLVSTFLSMEACNKTTTPAPVDHPPDYNTSHVGQHQIVGWCKDASSQRLPAIDQEPMAGAGG